MDLEKISLEKIALEKANKKLVFESTERKDSYERQVSKLNEEIQFIKSSMQQVKLDPNLMASAEATLRNSLVSLELKFREVKEKFSAKSKAYDELEFESQQLKQTIDGLKTELNATNEASINDRKEKHKLEMNLIEAKNRLSESIVGMRQAEDRMKVVLAENEYLKQEN